MGERIRRQADHAVAPTGPLAEQTSGIIDERPGCDLRQSSLQSDRSTQWALIVGCRHKCFDVDHIPAQEVARMVVVDLDGRQILIQLCIHNSVRLELKNHTPLMLLISGMAAREEKTLPSVQSIHSACGDFIRWGLFLLIADPTLILVPSTSHIRSRINGDETSHP